MYVWTPRSYRGLGATPPDPTAVKSFHSTQWSLPRNARHHDSTFREASVLMPVSHRTITSYIPNYLLLHREPCSPPPAYSRRRTAKLQTKCIGRLGVSRKTNTVAESYVTRLAYRCTRQQHLGILRIALQELVHQIGTLLRIANSQEG